MSRDEASRVGNFDGLAPHYGWMEALGAGGLLQRCRTAHLEAIPPPDRVLVCGEGNGRFLAELLRGFPDVEVTVLDASARMLELTRRRLSSAGISHGRVCFVHEDARHWVAPAGCFDLIVTHFFLDCFSAEELRRLVPKIARAASPRAQWLLADFQVAPAGFARLRSRVILALRYAFFRQTTGLSAREITAPDGFLEAAGFRLKDRRVFSLGLLHSDWWCRGGPDV